jgi:DUF2950 family protein
MKPATMSVHSQFALGALAAVCMALPAPTHAESKVRQATYETPQQAVDALVAAAKSGDPKQIVGILGPEGQEVSSSGDPVADAAGRERFLAAYDEAHELKQGDSRATLVIGKQDFPFPIPIVSSKDGWRFDTEAGADEILDRRIGNNEIQTIGVLKSYVDAQREYAETDRDGKGVQYARRILSSDGKSDGLYWPTSEGEPESPFGPLIGYARAEGYAAQAGRPTPYHGYLYRVLTAQGKDAKGGARDYIVNGRMIGGYALVASPAEYGNSGVMTFIVNQDGTIFQKNLGEASARIAAKMNEFNPGDGWTEVSAP